MTSGDQEGRPFPSPRWPTDEERVPAFERYTTAVGKVVYAWNYLQEKLAVLFSFTSVLDRDAALIKWYSVRSDRRQRDFLRASFDDMPSHHWPSLDARGDLDWLLDVIDEFAEDRNDAIHAPASLYIRNSEDGGHAMGPAFFNGNPRAKNLIGKDLLSVFAWCERYAEALSRYVMLVETGLKDHSYPWPDRPLLPGRPAD